MFKFFLKHFPQFALTGLLLLCLWLLVGRPQGQSPKPSFLKNVAMALWLPVQKAVASALSFPEETMNAVRELGNLREEVKRLQLENQTLRQEASARSSLERELARLKDVMKVKGQFPRSARIARIIAHDPSTWNQSFIIDVGAEEGILPDSPVVSEQGLVGRVLEVSASHSRVLLLTDADSSVAGIDERSRVTGVIQGTGGSRLRFAYVEAREDVQKDDRLVSSGLGGVFPKGYLIGSVVNRVELEKGLATEIEVVSSVDFAALDYVFVLPPMDIYR